MNKKNKVGFSTTSDIDCYWMDVGCPVSIEEVSPCPMDKSCRKFKKILVYPESTSDYLGERNKIRKLNQKKLF